MVFQADSTQLNILITGGGLIGGSLAMDYAESLPEATVTIYDINPQAAQELRALLRKKGVTDVKIISEKSELLKVAADADVVDHCVPIDALQDVQKNISGHLKSGTVVTNRGSAQAYASASIVPHIGKAIHFGIHPVVGRERLPGKDIPINAGLFRDNTAIMEPLDDDASDTEKVAHAKLKSINEAIGFNVKILPSNIHDKLLGALSHENTLGLQTLVNTREDKVSSGLGATMMRAASGTTGMWSPIHEFNSAAVSASHDIQTKHLQELQRLLENDDVDGLHALVSEANEFRSEWNDDDQNIEALDGAIEELGAKGAGITSTQLNSQISVPFAVSIARTLGIKETVRGLKSDLKQYGHSYVDLLNSSARDSTLAARYEPELVVSLLVANKDAVLEGISEFSQVHASVVNNVERYAAGHKADGLSLRKHIEGATLTMASDSTPKPRKTDGDDDFEPFKNPVQAYEKPNGFSSKKETIISKPVLT